MLQGSPAFAPPDQPEDYMVLSNEYEKLQNRPPVVIEKEDKRADFLEELGERGTNIEELMWFHKCGELRLPGKASNSSFGLPRRITFS